MTKTVKRPILTHLKVRRLEVSFPFAGLDPDVQNEIRLQWGADPMGYGGYAIWPLCEIGRSVGVLTASSQMTLEIPLSDSLTAETALLPDWLPSIVDAEVFLRADLENGGDHVRIHSDTSYGTFALKTGSVRGAIGIHFDLQAYAIRTESLVGDLSVSLDAIALGHPAVGLLFKN